MFWEFLLFQKKSWVKVVSVWFEIINHESWSHFARAKLPFQHFFRSKGQNVQSIPHIWNRFYDYWPSWKRIYWILKSFQKPRIFKIFKFKKSPWTITLKPFTQIFCDRGKNFQCGTVITFSFIFIQREKFWEAKTGIFQFEGSVFGYLLSAYLQL